MDKPIHVLLLKGPLTDSRYSNLLIASMDRSTSPLDSGRVITSSIKLATAAKTRCQNQNSFIHKIVPLYKIAPYNEYIVALK